MEVEQVVVRLVADTSQYFASLDYAGARLLGYTAGLATGIAKHGIQMAATFEKNAVAVKTMVGNAAEGAKLIQDITNLAIETPFSSDELVAVTKQLKSFGFETDTVVDTLKVLGNVSAGTGTDIHRISLAFGQVKVAGKLMGTELRQFVDAGVPLIEYLGKVMKKPSESIRSLTEQGQIGFAQVVEAFNLMNAEGGHFAGLMDVISKTTIGGRWQAFKETLDVASRNFAMMAVEGLGLKDALGGASEALQDMNKASGGEGIRNFFADVRLSVNAVWMVLRKVAEAVGYVYREVRAWTQENKETVRYILLAVAAIWTLYAAVKAVTVSIVLMKAALAAVYFMSGLASLLSGFLALKAMIVGIVASVGAFLAVAAPIAAVIGLVVGTLMYLDAFRFSGSAFSQGMEAMGEMKKVFQSVVDALKSGDLESAWELVIAGFLYAWRVMVLTLKGEWDAFMKGLMSGVNIHFRALVSGFNYTQLRAGDEAKRKQLEEEMQVANVASQYGLSEYNARELIAYQEAAAKAFKEQQAWEKEMKERFPENLHGGGNAILKKIEEAAAWRANADKMVANIIKRAGGEQDELLKQKQAAGFANDPVLKQRKAELDRLYKQVADNAYDSLIEAIYAEAEGAAQEFAQMAVPLGISAKARDVMNDLEKELMKGVTSFDHFSSQIKLLTEARFGNQAMQDVAGAAIGGFAAVGGVGPMKDPSFRFGLFREFEEVRKKVGNTDTQMPPSLLRGSSEAQNVINANMSRQISVEEEVLAVLIANKTLHEQSVEYQKQVADAMKKFKDDPKKIGLFGF